MTVPARILIQILLMIFFRREEILERRHFDSELGAVFCFLVLIHGLNLGHLSFFRVIYSCPVLNAAVISLLVHGQRINDRKIIPKQLRYYLPSDSRFPNVNGTLDLLSSV